MDVILITQVENLGDRDIFEKHLKKEGFLPIENESFAYQGSTTTSLMHTETFILHIVKDALNQARFSTCKLIFQVGNNEMKAFMIEKNQEEFIRAQL